jgi:hypothetical protein
MRSGVSLARPSQQAFALHAGRQIVRFVAETLGLGREAFFQRQWLLETESLLHDMLPCFCWAGAQPAFSSPIDTQILR